MRIIREINLLFFGKDTVSRLDIVSYIMFVVVVTWMILTWLGYV